MPDIILGSDKCVTLMDRHEGVSHVGGERFLERVQRYRMVKGPKMGVCTCIGGKCGCVASGLE